MQFGTVLALPLSGFLCDVNLDGGWPLAFYVPGFLAVIWFLGWWWAVSDSPENDPHISEDERKFIQISTGNLQRDATVSLVFQYIFKHLIINDLVFLLVTNSLAGYGHFGSRMGHSHRPYWEILGIFYSSNRTTNLFEHRASLQHESRTRSHTWLNVSHLNSIRFILIPELFAFGNALHGYVAMFHHIQLCCRCATKQTYP